MDGKLFRSKDLVGLPIDVDGHGRGVVLRYDKAVGVRTKGLLIDFEVGGRSKDTLRKKTFKVMNVEFVNKTVDEQVKQFDAELANIVAATTAEAKGELMHAAEAWVDGDKEDEKALVGKTIRIQTASKPHSSFDVEGAMQRSFDAFENENIDDTQLEDGKVGTIVDFKKKRFFVKFDDDQQITKSKLEEKFLVLDDNYIEELTAPKVSAAVAPWAQERCEHLIDEHHEQIRELQIETEAAIEVYMRQTEIQELDSAMCAAAYLQTVQVQAYEIFASSFRPTAAGMDPELIEDAGGLDAVLESTWIAMELEERCAVQNSRRDELCPGASAGADVSEYHFSADASSFRLRIDSLQRIVPSIYLSGADKEQAIKETDTDMDDTCSLETFVKWLSRAKEGSLAERVRETVEEMAWPELDPLLNWSDPATRPQEVEKKRRSLRSGLTGSFALGAAPVRGITKLTYSVGKPLAKGTVQGALAVAKPAVQLSAAVAETTGKAAGVVAGSSNADNVQVSETRDEKAIRIAFSMLDQDGDGLLQRNEIAMMPAVAGLPITNEQLEEAQAELFEQEAEIKLESFKDWWNGGSDMAIRLATESRFASDSAAAAELRELRAQLEHTSSIEARQSPAAWVAVETLDAGAVLGIGREVKLPDERTGAIEKEGKKIEIRLQNNKIHKVKDRRDFDVLDEAFVKDFIRKEVQRGMKKGSPKHTDKKNKKLEKKQSPPSESPIEGESSLPVFETERAEETLARAQMANLGALTGVNLTKTELDTAMAEMMKMSEVSMLVTNDMVEAVQVDTFDAWLKSDSAVVAKIQAGQQKNASRSRKERKREYRDRPTIDEITSAVFIQLDTQNLGELDQEAFKRLPELAGVELTETEMSEAWRTLDPENKEEVLFTAFVAWFDSGSPISDKVKADPHGYLEQIGREYKIEHRNLKRGKSLDDERIMVVYKEDVEEQARTKAASQALVQDGAWRHGETVLSEIDPEDLVGKTINIDGVGRGQVTGYKNKKYSIQIGSNKQEPTRIKLPSKKVHFTVLSTQFVDRYIEAAVNRAIAKWANKESQIRKRFEHEALQKALSMKEAWGDGGNILDPDDYIDQRVEVRGLGQGTVVDYLEESEIKANIGKHIIEFDSGKTETLQLTGRKNEIRFKVMNQAFVNQYVQRAMREWSQSRTKPKNQVADEDSSKLGPKKLSKLGRLKSAMSGQKSYDHVSQASRDSVDEQRMETQIIALREMFKQYDTDGDGYLQRTEFDDMAYELGFKASATQLDEAWIEVDTPELLRQGEEALEGHRPSDKVTFEKLKDFLLSDLVVSMSASLLQSQLLARVETYKSDMLLLKRLFTKYDADGNGLIDFEEYETLATALQFSGNINDLAETFKEIDTDGSGSIEFSEFKTFFTSNNIDLGASTDLLRDLIVEQLEEDRITVDTLRAVFAKHDDGRGFIDKFDFDVFADQLGYRGKETDLEDMFEAMDADANGLISWDEWIDYFLPLVGDGDTKMGEIRRNMFEKYQGDSIDLKILRQMFDKVDINNNGTIDSREFKKLCGKLGFAGSEKDIFDSFSRADEDGSGTIDWNEFRDWYNAKNPDAVVQAMQREREAEEERSMMLKSTFEAFDGDGNGVLDRAEFKRMAKAIKLDANAKELEAYFKEIDQDKSGEIDFAEFVVWYATTGEESVLKHKVKSSIGTDKKALKKVSAARSIFRSIDTNGNGEVSSDEMMQLAVDLGIQTSKEEFKIIFQEMDLDGGGTIDIMEFNEWMSKRGGRGDRFRKQMLLWHKSTAPQGGGSSDHEDVGFGKGRALLGTARVTGKATYFFSRSSGAYSELKQVAAEQLPLPARSGFSTIDKVVYFHQTQLFEKMDLLEVLRVAQAATQINLEEGDTLFEEGDEGHATYFVVNGEMTLHTAGIHVPITNNKKPFGEISLLSSEPRAGKMTAKTETTLMCLFRDDMQELFRKNAVNENKFMHALGELVISSLRFNYSQLQKLSEAGTLGSDLAMEIARSGWTYDNSDFIQIKPARSVAAYSRTRRDNLELFVSKVVKSHAINAVRPRLLCRFFGA
eukprot:SAG31_NODE_261_length_18904_cov_115.315554_4_plen_2049_part_00